ncbi:tetratricopeptide repeat protein [Zoogloea sp.]|uniref:tetratricopeptide repeat protein n=1 Tax=Zoogloea sp. TaxID=49181 RepID=UPI00321FFDF1
MPRPSSLVWLRPLVFAATLVVGALYFSYPSADYLYKAGSFSLARPLYVISAVMGNDKAQHQLASMHMKAQGGPYNPSAAASWYARAAGQGNGLSATALGDIYLKGVGVDADPVKAVALFEQAAGQGEEEAILNLGRLYSEGTNGVPKNGEKARYWYEQGAERNIPAAQYGLAGLHASGELVPRNLRQAEFWYLKAARRGHAKAQLELGTLYLKQPPSAISVKGAQVWLTEASRQKETASAAQEHLSTLCRNNPALTCPQTAPGPSLGALLPPAARRRL